MYTWFFKNLQRNCFIDYSLPFTITPNHITCSIMSTYLLHIIVELKKIGVQGLKQTMVELFVSNLWFVIFIIHFLFIYHYNFFTAIKVTPRSIKHESVTNPDCQSKRPLEISSDPLQQGEKLSIVYTYSVRFQVSLGTYFKFVFELHSEFIFNIISSKIIQLNGLQGGITF